MTAQVVVNNDIIIGNFNSRHFVSFLNWLDSKDGHQNSVFIGKFRIPGKGEIDAFVKIYPYEAGTNKGLINEITGYLFAHALNVPQPASAFICHIPLMAIRGIDNLPEHHFLRIAKNKQPHYPAFCTQRLDGKSAGLHLPASMTPTLVKDISGWKSLPSAIVLDENIAHCDRHVNNLIRLGPKNYAAIDNGRLVNESGEYWDNGMLDCNKLYTNKLSHIVHGNGTDIPSYQQMADLSANILERIKPIEKELQGWFNLLLSKEENQSFNEFLNKRAEDLVWLISRRYNKLH